MRKFVWLVIAAVVGAGVGRYWDWFFPKKPDPIVACVGVSSAATGKQDPKYLITATYLMENRGEKETDEMPIFIDTQAGKITDISPEIKVNLKEGGVEHNTAKFTVKLFQKEQKALKVVYGDILASTVPPELKGIPTLPNFEPKEFCF